MLINKIVINNIILSNNQLALCDKCEIALYQDVSEVIRHQYTEFKRQLCLVRQAPILLTD